MSASVALQVQQSALGGFAAERFAIARVLSFVEAAGIARVLAEHSPFALAEGAPLLQSSLGFAGDAVRSRMLRVLLDLLSECGCLRPGSGDTRALSELPLSAHCESGGSQAGPRLGADGQVEFFERCLGHVEAFLRGAPPLFDFGPDSAAAWDGLLGSESLSRARAILARLLLPRDDRGMDVLVLCYGPGFDLVQIEARCPGARVTALDFTNAFKSRAWGRLRAPERVCWVDAGSWGGFGTALPFPGESFDLVVFSCAEPYIPLDRRPFTLRDLRRVVRPGGRVGVLTHSYPDEPRRAVPDPWLRRVTLCHDFLESVCQGWCGFSEAAALHAEFESAGFRVDLVTHNSSIWRLANPVRERGAERG